MSPHSSRTFDFSLSFRCCFHFICAKQLLITDNEYQCPVPWVPQIQRSQHKMKCLAKQVTWANIQNWLTDRIVWRRKRIRGNEICRASVCTRIDFGCNIFAEPFLDRSIVARVKWPRGRGRNLFSRWSALVFVIFRFLLLFLSRVLYPTIANLCI